jgi:hypothetical protein
MNILEAQVPPIQEVEIEEIEAFTKDPIKKFKPNKNMVEINPLRGNITVKKGQQLYYSAKAHYSVGYSPIANSSDNKALPLNRSFLEYDNKQEPGLCGGDSATKYFIFDTTKAGTYEIVVARNFRGDLENEHTIVITVEE